MNVWMSVNLALSPWSMKLKDPKFYWTKLFQMSPKVKSVLSVCRALLSLECTFCSSVFNHCIFFHLDKGCLLIAFSTTFSCFAQLCQGLRPSWLQFPGTMIRSQLTGTEEHHTFAP